jgi:hypothetical protein
MHDELVGMLAGRTIRVHRNVPSTGVPLWTTGRERVRLQARPER